MKSIIQSALDARGRELTFLSVSVSVFVLIISSFFTCTAYSATCDQYRGDLWAYTASVKPNMLIIMDTSGSMNDPFLGSRKIAIARDVISQLIDRTKGINFGVMIYNNKGNDRKDSEGSRFFNFNTGGSTYTSTIKDMDGIHPGWAKLTNRQALVDAIGSISAGGYTPLAESLLEAGQYFRGGVSKFGNTIGIGAGGTYQSPITARCQKNVIVFITDGMSTSDDHNDLKDPICPASKKNCQGDLDGDKMEPAPPPSGGGWDSGGWFTDSTNMWHAVDDVAKYLHETDLLPDTSDPKTVGLQSIDTYFIGFGEVGANATAKALLERAANSDHGNGAAYMAKDKVELVNALGSIISSVASVEAAFVSPMVPATAEGVARNTNRLYIGLFKSRSGKSWQGNLKKYGLKSDGTVLDKNGSPATLIDGSFDPSKTSYWSSSADGGQVTAGGAGAALLSQSLDDRKIYTYVAGNTKQLADPVNAFSTNNIKLTAGVFGLTTDAEKTSLIQFMRGLDSYDENANGVTSEKRDWLFGDVLHSRPSLVNYSSYASGEESVCEKNTSLVFVGSNDGMLHAVNDCNGTERWSFIPPDILNKIKEIPGKIHTYGVDASPIIYQYDANRNGVIEKAAGDLALLIFGTRRGGGEGGAPTRGSYHVLNITDPSAPEYLWSISSESADFSELAEGWAEPRITKMRIGNSTKVVAILPGGYDNPNEDSRYGAIPDFEGTGTVYYSDSGSGPASSIGGNPALNGRGRGLYVVGLASLGNSGPTVASLPERIWGVIRGDTTNYASSPATDVNLTHALTADVAVLDVNGDGYTDRVYATDLGGKVWRFDMRSTSPSQWTGNRIFSANPTTGSDTGRKLFFKPAVTLESRSTNAAFGLDATIFIGSGDREHPNNTAVVDRLYAIRDKGQGTAVAIGEGNLVDLTLDQLQGADGSQVNATLALLQNPAKYGWYIKLNQRAGEKAVSSPTVFNRVAYFSTYSPNLNPAADPCAPSVGTGRIYAVNYATGEAVFNFDKNNDSPSGVTNTRARQGDINLLRDDRFLELGPGVPSGAVIKENSLLVGVGGGGDDGGNKVLNVNIGSGKRFIPLYWGQR